jgi:hypothetical protein
MDIFELKGNQFKILFGNRIFISPRTISPLDHFPDSHFSANHFPVDHYPGNTSPRITLPRITFPRSTYLRVTFPRITFFRVIFPRVTFPRVTFPRITFQCCWKPCTINLQCCKSNFSFHLKKFVKQGKNNKFSPPISTFVDAAVYISKI